jgi:hypothetical protein
VTSSFRLSCELILQAPHGGGFTMETSIGRLRSERFALRGKTTLESELGTLMDAPLKDKRPAAQ